MQVLALFPLEWGHRALLILQSRRVLVVLIWVLVVLIWFVSA